MDELLLQNTSNPANKCKELAPWRISQGDPCAPFAFALFLHKLLKRIGTLNLETNLNAWYLDDGKIIAKHAVLRRALDFIHSEGPEIGLVHNLSKFFLKVLFGDEAQELEAAD
jgi:hypothetical protein